MSRIVIGDSKTSLFGFVGGDINSSVYDKFCHDYSKIEDTTAPLTIGIRSCGGSHMYSLMIANIICSHQGPVIIEVPNKALSAATFLALLGDQIIASPHAVFSPFDGQIMGFSLRNLVKSFSLESDTGFKAFIRNIAVSKTESIDRSLMYFLNKKYSPEEVEEIRSVFLEGLDHNTPIFISDLPKCVAKKLTVQNLTTPEQPKSSDSGNILSSLISGL